MDEKEIEDYRKAKKAVETPAMKAMLEHHAIEVRKLSVKIMLEQQHECQCAKFRVSRERNVVNITWEMKRKYEREYVVAGVIRDIDFIPDPHHGTGRYIAYGNERKSVRLELEEGHAYLFEFLFLDVERCESHKKKTGKEADFLEEIFFQVAVPLSEGKKIKQQPEKKLEIEMTKYLKVEDTFDKLCEMATEQIRSKKLSPEEEHHRLERFKLRAGLLKDDLGG